LRIKTQDMNREILRLAVPNIISNITVPLMGIVSSAVAGHLDNSAATIGALAIGVSIFNFIYWNCCFVRMGTSGLTAQAFGAGNFHECTNMLVRGILVAAILGLLVICFQNPLGRLALWAMNGNEIVHDYFYARIWAVPAGIMLFGFNGWYTGMQNAVIPMCIAVTVNIVHVSTSLWLVFGHGMGITGIAYGSVVAQNTGVLLAVLLLILRYRKILTRFTWREVVDWEPVRKFFLINRDIIISYALYRSRIYLLHGGIGPYGGPDPADGQYASAPDIHPFLLHERRLRLCRRSPHGTLHRSPGRTIAASLPGTLSGLGHTDLGAVRRHNTSGGATC